ncbi:MAG: benzoyl-CoA 2,3-epoxidase subunit BoxB [Deltaproteobacteria bacterium CG17_big_fil_post_rev_8_21_14_2_50_63_7]|nr:MAG: benzoyl-CoA 2,3-epoxidase subunit BoxB [Deltaproteobacteria bacterium CG17_big_fil_post_rev_8_21_14_2_50_63_7]
MSIDLDDKIPNNVDLSSDRRLQKALEAWQPNFKAWWMDMGPSSFQQDQIYLRTAVSVEKGGWAHYDYVKMPDYRWGIFLAPGAAEKTIGFGDHLGQPVWDKVPGDYRKELRRIIVTQGDTEPASVEQQKLLGKCAPSLYDLRNLFQVNVEEGRHLWAMVYLLHSYFGRDGRDEAEEMLARRSGDADSPRILAAFNKPIDDWLSFFCFTMFTDRDGKFQLAALAESGFAPLARTTQFMLTEEAHHLFVGQTGVNRIVQRTAELMKKTAGDVTKQGGIPLEIIQRTINFWFSASIDLFGGEDSSNAASYFAYGLKGRYKESSSDQITDHQALEGAYTLDTVQDGKVTSAEVPLRRAMNELLRDAYIEDCQKALAMWNKTLSSVGVSEQLTLPSHRFNREVGAFAGLPINPAGEMMPPKKYATEQFKWLPSAADRAYVQSLMVPVYGPGQFANWIAPPPKGINGQPVDFEYVKFH